MSNNSHFNAPPFPFPLRDNGLSEPSHTIHPQTLRRIHTGNLWHKLTHTQATAQTLSLTHTHPGWSPLERLTGWATRASLTHLMWQCCWLWALRENLLAFLPFHHAVTSRAQHHNSKMHSQNVSFCACITVKCDSICVYVCVCVCVCVCEQLLGTKTCPIFSFQFKDWMKGKVFLRFFSGHMLVYATVCHWFLTF